MLESVFLQTMTPKQAYPVVLLNDGGTGLFIRPVPICDFSGFWFQKTVWMTFTPWKLVLLKEGAPDFWWKGRCHNQKVFQGILTTSKKSYLIDESRIAYGGYSLGGLAAVYSLYSNHLPMTCIFSICGSFWYPGTL